jgi:hypothetical protein
MDNAEAIDIEPTQAVVLAPPQHDLIVSRPPEVVLEEARRAAVALGKVLASKPKKVEFGGRRYLEIDDWTLLGRFYGVTVRIVSTQPIEVNGAHGWEAFAEAIRISDGAVLSRVESMCLSDEPNWRNKPQMQLRSMAQTRACSRAFATVLRWVPVLAGYAGTPAEEMDGMHAANPVRSAAAPRVDIRRQKMLDKIREMETTLGEEHADKIASEHSIDADIGTASDDQLTEYGKALRGALDAQ